MPIYEYRCEKGHSFDVMQRMSDDPLTACQVCEAPVRKVLHSPAVHFKGSGFYTTDYGKKKSVGGSSSNAKENGSSDSGSSDSSSSSDSKGKSDSAKSASKSD
jgi:putative FmdB family regulatory protein